MFMEIMETKSKQQNNILLFETKKNENKKYSSWHMVRYNTLRWHWPWTTMFFQFFLNNINDQEIQPKMWYKEISWHS